MNAVLSAHALSPHERAVFAPGLVTARVALARNEKASINGFSPQFPRDDVERARAKPRCVVCRMIALAAER